MRSASFCLVGALYTLILPLPVRPLRALQGHYTQLDQAIAPHRHHQRALPHQVGIRVLLWLV